VLVFAVLAPVQAIPNASLKFATKSISILIGALVQANNGK